MRGKEEWGGKMERLKEAEEWNIKGNGGVTFIEQGTSIRNKSCLCGREKGAGGDKEMH